ncbi:hypothetical protein [Hymenobacter psychrophilus]|uniref:Uncharacterized protein n=1 Tax=Hymenobacter psychrophilus TaxID=651662 RepID=A0A1H3BWM8_9BACT|nr:hypothetical protein [Hymenobacter psychrophilus]SDX46135.1 hypothetical protein SAMN04488069_101447 [Hymenobacter psychrophilus]
MPFTVQQTIIPPPPVPPTSWWKDASSSVLLVLMAIPVVIIGIGALLVLGIGYGVWSAGAKIILPIRKLFGYQPPPGPPPIPEVPVVLFQNEQLRLLTTEQESGAVSREFEIWWEAWDGLEDRGHFPGLYRLHTAPEIAGLHGQLVCELCREWSDGLFLQLIEPLPGQVPPATTWLIYLELATLRWHRVVETNDYYLHPNTPGLEQGAFEGLNPAGKKLELRVQTHA